LLDYLQQKTQRAEFTPTEHTEEVVHMAENKALIQQEFNKQAHNIENEKFGKRVFYGNVQW
jgi:hypothetical protein